MRYFDAVMQSRPDFYFPLEQSSINYGKYQDELDSLSEWTPSQISTSLWLDADDSSSIEIVGGKVSQWKDKSGNNNHAFQTNASLRPVVNASALNGKDTIAFNKTPMKIDKAQWSDNIAIFAVARNSSPAGSNDGLAILNATEELSFPASYGFRFDAYSLTDSHRLGISSDGTGSFASYPRSGNTNFFQQIGWYDGSTINLIVDAMSSPNQSSAESGPIDYTSITESVVGGYDSTITSYGLVGDIAEIVVLPRSPSEDERFKIQHYLARKWNTAISTNNTYSVSSPVYGDVQYKRFPNVSSSQYAVDINSNLLSYSELLPSIPYKIWKKNIVFECVFVPKSQPAGLFRTVDSYVDEESGALLEDQNTVSIDFTGDNYNVTVFDETFLSYSVTSGYPQHLVVSINDGEVDIYINGVYSGGGVYEDFDLYNYQVSDIITSGTGYISNIALYTSSQNISDIVAHHQYMYSPVLVKNFWRNDQSQTFIPSKEALDQYEEFSFPRHSNDRWSWEVSSPKNIYIDQALGSIWVRDRLSLSPIDGLVSTTQQSIVIDKGIRVVDFNACVTTGDTFSFSFTPLSVQSAGGGTDICVMDGSLALLEITVLNGKVVVSYSDDSYDYYDDQYEINLNEYTVNIELLSESINVELIQSSTTVASYSIASNQILSGDTLVSLFSDYSGGFPLPAELTAVSVSDDSLTKHLVDIPNLDSYSSCSFICNIYKQSMGDTRLFYSPDNSTIDIETNTGTTLRYGDIIPADTTSLKVTLTGSQDIPTPMLFGILGYTDLSKRITSEYGDGTAVINGDVITPMIPKTYLNDRSPYKNMSLLSGQIEYAGKDNSNYVRDSSTVNPSQWTATNCTISAYRGDRSISGYGIRAVYSSQAPKVSSEKISVLPSSEYVAAINVLNIYDAKTMTFGVSWFNSSGGLIMSTSNSINVDTVSQRFILPLTSPATAKYAELYVSAITGTGEFIIESAFFQEEFDDTIQGYERFKYVSIVFSSDSDTFDLFSHEYDKEYSISFTDGNVTFTGFNEVILNGSIISSGTPVSDLDGTNHIVAKTAELDALTPTPLKKMFVGSTENSGRLEIQYFDIGTSFSQSEYEKLFGQVNTSTVSDSSGPNITLESDNVVFVARPWTVIQ